jgi:hypothetical protein
MNLILNSAWSQLRIYMWRQLTLKGIYNGLNSHNTNSGTLSCSVPKPFKFTEHNFIACNIKPSTHPRFPAWSLLWRTRAVRSACSHNKRWRLISLGYLFSWSQSMLYQRTSELLKCWGERNGTDGDGIATQLCKNRKRLTLNSGSPEYEVLGFMTQRWVEWDKRNRGNRDCTLYVYESPKKAKSLKVRSTNHSSVNGYSRRRVKQMWVRGC